MIERLNQASLVNGLYIKFLTDGKNARNAYQNGQNSNRRCIEDLAISRILPYPHNTGHGPKLIVIDQAPVLRAGMVKTKTT
jgi:hypothetical protein